MSKESTPFHVRVAEDTPVYIHVLRRTDRPPKSQYAFAARPPSADQRTSARQPASGRLPRGTGREATEFPGTRDACTSTDRASEDNQLLEAQNNLLSSTMKLLRKTTELGNHGKWKGKDKEQVTELQKELFFKTEQLSSVFKILLNSEEDDDVTAEVLSRLQELRREHQTIMDKLQNTMTAEEIRSMGSRDDPVPLTSSQTRPKEVCGIEMMTKENDMPDTVRELDLERGLQQLERRLSEVSRKSKSTPLSPGTNVSRLTSENEKLKLEKQIFQKEKAELEAKLDHFSSLLSDTKAKLKISEEDLTAAQSRLSEQALEKDEVESSLMQSVDDLRQKLERSEATNKSLQNYIKFLKISYANIFSDSSVVNVDSQASVTAI